MLLAIVRCTRYKVRNLYTLYHTKTVPYTSVIPKPHVTRVKQPSNNIVGHDRQNHGASWEFKW